MKRKKPFNVERSEKIANIYLSSIKDVVVHRAPIKYKADFIIQPKDNPDSKVIVEVKSYNKINGIKESKTLTKRLLKSKIPSVIIYIDSVNEEGYFKIVDSDNSNKLFSLTGNTISNQITKLVKK
jgi:hypothetical protein